MELVELNNGGSIVIVAISPPTMSSAAADGAVMVKIKIHQRMARWEETKQDFDDKQYWQYSWLTLM